MAELSNAKVIKIWKDIDLKLKHNLVDDEISGDLRATKYKGIDPSKIGADIDLWDAKGNTRDGSKNIDGSFRQQHIIKYLVEDLEKERNNRIARYDRLKKAMQEPEIAGALNIYADEVCTEDENGAKLHVMSDDQEVKDIVEDLFSRLGIEDKMWPITRDACGFGDDFSEVVVNATGDGIRSIVQIPRQLIDRVEKNGVLQGFKVIPPESDLTEPDFAYYQVAKQKDMYDQDEELESLIAPFRVLHWKIDSSKYTIFGESILEPVLDTLEQLRIMEKAMLIARVSRAPERRIYNINVGRLVGERALQYARMAVQTMFNKKRTVETASGRINAVKDAFGSSEEYLLPFRQGEEKNSIDTLPSANGLDQIGDVEFFRDRIFPGIGIPRQYLFDDAFANANLNLSSKSVPFAKKIRRIQRFVLYNLYKLARIELKLKGKANFKLDQFTITMNNPSTINERELLEIDTQRWGLIGQIKALNAEGVFYPDYEIYTKYLNLTSDEIVEILKLSQLQQAGQNYFNAFEPSERPEGSEDLDFAGAAGAGGEGGAGGAGGGGAPPVDGAEGEIPAEAEEALGDAPAEGGEAPAEAPEVSDVGADFNKVVYSDEELALMTPQQRAMTKKESFLKVVGVAPTAKIVPNRPNTIEEKKEMAKLVKEEFLNAYQKTTVETIEIIEKSKERRKQAERTKSRLGALSYMEASGDMKGMANFTAESKREVFTEKLEAMMNSKIITEDT